MSFIKKEFRVSCSALWIDKLDKLFQERLMFESLERRVDLNLGVNDDKVGQYAVKSFIATDALKEGLVDVLVTAQ
jgi:4-hydroxythreonine-4-phosphate dehydrogenase